MTQGRATRRGYRGYRESPERFARPRERVHTPRGASHATQAETDARAYNADTSIEAIRNLRDALAKRQGEQTARDTPRWRDGVKVP